jgi:hypothetical protein
MSIATVRFGTKTTGPGKFDATTPLRLEKERHLTRVGRQKCIFVADGSNTQRGMTRYDLHMRSWRVFVERLSPIRQHDEVTFRGASGCNLDAILEIGGERRNQLRALVVRQWDTTAW